MHKNNKTVIDARNLHYRELNSIIRQYMEIQYQNIISQDTYTKNGYVNKDDSSAVRRQKIPAIKLKNVTGQRYIGCGVKGDIKINIYGTPGNDMAAFMDGPEIEVFGNGQDGIANTMNSGRIIIHGDSGDIMGYSMRGGEIYVEGSVGWRSGIHMKSYLEKFPVIIIGGKTGNFLGEYMAGGRIVVLGLDFSGNSIAGDFVGTGMHGGAIFLRGDVDESRIGKEVRKMQLDTSDIEAISGYIKNFCNYFNKDYSKIVSQNFKDFIKLTPYSHRPYGKLYSY